jgi:tetratricopeptide (TPR) repeat protein
MNRWRPIQVLCVLGLGVLPVAAQETPPHDHDHAAGVPHSHNRQPKSPQEETTVDYLWRKSDIAFHDGDYPRAIACHKAIVVLAPDDVESYSVAAWLMWSLGNGDEALAHIQRGLNANPNSWEMWEAAGNQYDLQKQHNEAKAAYQRAVALIPKEENSLMLRRRLAHAAERAGDIDLSVQTWRGLVRDFPNDVVNKNNLARVEKALNGTPANQA